MHHIAQHVRGALAATAGVILALTVGLAAPAAAHAAPRVDRSTVGASVVAPTPTPAHGRPAAGSGNSGDNQSEDWTW